VATESQSKNEIKLHPRSRVNKKKPIHAKQNKKIKLERHFHLCDADHPASERHRPKRKKGADFRPHPSGRSSRQREAATADSFLSYGPDT
jgi:hypothetical protein